jgi:multidrug efflux system membrane fusion protein
VEVHSDRFAAMLLEPDVLQGRGFVTAPQFQLTAPLTGKVAQVAVKVGQRVKQGDLLVRLDDFTAKSELEIAKANLEVAQVELGASADREKESGQRAARAKVRAAEAQLALLEHRYAQAGIAAPADGVVSELAVEQGTSVREGGAVATIVAVDRLSFSMNMDVDRVDALKVGQKVSLRIDNEGDRTFEGTLTFIAPTVDPATRSVRVDVRINNAAGIKLRPGLIGTAAFKIETGAGK